MRKRASRLFRSSDFGTPSSLNIRHSSFRAEGAFTIIELLVVITIIVILAGLILSTIGYVQKKGARARAEAEIAAMSAALESYKADNGIYPRDATNQYTDTLNAKSNFTFRPQMLGGTRDANGNVNPVTYIRDPFGNSYGYSTAYQADSSKGYNPTFDLWSTANSTDANANQWIKNW